MSAIVKHRRYQKLFPGKAQLLLCVLDLLFRPGGVCDVLLDLELSCWIYSLPGSVQRTRVTIGPRLAGTFVSPVQDSTLTVAPEGSQGTNWTESVELRKFVL